MAAKSAPQTASAALEQAIARHYEIQELVEVVHTAPQPLDAAKADAARVVSRIAGEWDFEHTLGYLARPNDWYNAARVLLAPATHGNMSAPPTTVLARVAPQLLERFLAEELEKHYEGLPASMTNEERKARLAKLASEHAANQTAMSEAWWRLADAGMPPPPPAELEAAALLGLETDAP